MSKEKKEIVLIEEEKINPLEVFKEGGLEPVLREVEKRAKELATVDVNTKEGASTIKTVAYEVSRSKTFIDDIGKNLVADWKTKAKSVDAERKRSRDFLDALKEKVRRPLTEIEERAKAIDDRIERIRALGTFDYDPNAGQLEFAISEAKEFYDFEFGEKQESATAVFDMVVSDLEERLRIRVKQDEEQAELEKLRKEKADREQQAKPDPEPEAEQPKKADVTEDADRNHKAAINRAALAALGKEGLDEQSAMKVLTAIVRGKIPNVKITY